MKKINLSNISKNKWEHLNFVAKNPNIPIMSKAIYTALISNENNFKITINKLSEWIGMSSRYVLKHLNELKALNIVVVEPYEIILNHMDTFKNKPELSKKHFNKKQEEKEKVEIVTTSIEVVDHPPVKFIMRKKRK